MSANAESLIVQPSSYVERLRLDELFSLRQPLEVELGTGDGSFLVEWARENPAHNFLGVERLLGRLRKAERKVKRAGLKNVRLLRIEAGYFLEYMLPARSVAALHVYFPDPWPKRKHWRHRLINDRFPGIAAVALELGAVVYLRTDDRAYFAQMTEVFDRSSAFEKAATPPELQSILTDFERDFQARGVSTQMVAYRLK